MIYVTSDIHGQFDKLKALLEKAEFGEDDFLFVLGDVIDRNGDGGIEMLRWMMHKPNVSLIMGNHEAMLLSCTFLLDYISDETLDALTAEQLGAAGTWMKNGAEVTLQALKAWKYEDPQGVDALLEYLREAPLWETVSVAGKEYLLVHGGLGNFKPRKKLAQYSPEELLWTRPAPDQVYFEEIYTLLGHTPTRHYAAGDKAFRTQTWMNIDTGAAYPEGSPMLFRLDDGKEFYL